MSEEAPNPFAGAADVDSAAAALTSLVGTRRNRPEAKAGQPAPEVKTETPSAPAADETNATDAPEVEPGEPPDNQQQDAPEAKDENGEEPLIEVKINGKTEKVTLSQLRSGYMMQQDYSRKSREVAEQRKQFELERNQVKSAIETRLNETGFLANALMQQLTAVEQNVNWEQLKQTDPNKFNALVVQVEQKRNLLKQAYDQYQQAQQMQAQQHQQELVQTLQQESARLPLLIPEWTDEKIAQSEKQQLATYLRQDDFLSESEVNELEDSRIVALARKAMLYDRMKSQRTALQQKADKPVPKLQKGGIQRTDASDQKSQNQLAKLKRSGSMDDAAQWLLLKHRKE